MISPMTKKILKKYIIILLFNEQLSVSRCAVFHCELLITDFTKTTINLTKATLQLK